MNTTENALETSLRSTEFEHQAPVITVTNDYKDTVPPQSSLYILSQNTTLYLLQLRTLYTALTLL